MLLSPWSKRDRASSISHEPSFPSPSHVHFPKQDIKGRETEGFRGFAASAPGKTRHSSLSEIASLGEPVGHRSPPSTAEQKIAFVSPFPRPSPCLLPSPHHPSKGSPTWSTAGGWGLEACMMPRTKAQGKARSACSPGREERSSTLYVSSHMPIPLHEASHNLSFPEIFWFPGHSLALPGMQCAPGLSKMY